MTIQSTNPSEQIIANGLEAHGYTVLTNGWPDFLAFDTEGHVRFIEIKPTCRQRFSARQARMAAALKLAGIEVELLVAACVCGDCEYAT